MNYRHLYHAGNFCDVFKHVLLISLIEFLKKKEKPFCYLETHAGAGRYDLTSAEVQKTKEYQNGILKLIEQNLKLNKIPQLIEDYVKIIQAQGFPSYYSGSPMIAKTQLRPDDRMILMELHQAEYQALNGLFNNGLNNIDDKHIAIHHQDGYLGLKAFLPPKERRGLIFIDPPYEKETEWEDLTHHLKMAYKRFSTGVYAIWYPIKDKKIVANFHRSLTNLTADNHEIMIAEIKLYPDDIMTGLIGCGVVIINPPWQWADAFSEVLPWLWQILSVNNQGSYSLRLLD